MSIDLEVKAGSPDGVDRIVSSIDRLHASMEKLGQTSALGNLAEQMKIMQATMVTGFANLAALAGQSETERERIATEGADKRLRAQLACEAKQHAAANKFHDKQIDIEAAAENKRASALQALIEKRDMQTLAAQQREAAEYVRFWERIVAVQDRAAATQVAIEQRRDSELHAMRAKEHNSYVAWWEKAAADRVAIERARDVEMHALRAKEHTDYTVWWQQQLATQEAAQRRQLEMERTQQTALATLRATAAEKQRVLNTGFITSPLSSQIATAEKAQVYGHLGGNAAEKFGSVAASADLAALRKQHELLPAAVRNSQNALQGHNDIMREGHSLARGLAGSLGGLWMTYGSIVPLVAGAAIAASLKNIVTAGKEVEYQLAFVQALGGGTVSLDQMLHITDATVVSVKEAAEGMRALAQNGMKAQESLKVLPSILNLAVIGEMSVSQAALAATGTVSAFGLDKIGDLDRVANIFAQAAATSNTSVIAMTESMKQGSTVAAVYGSTVEETAAALGVLAKVNIIGSAAGTAYTNMLTNLYTPTEKAKRALAELGVDSAKSNGELKNTTELMGELRNALAGYNDSAQASFLGDIFTVRGQKGASTILSNWDDYIRKTEEARLVTNFMGEGVSKLEDTVSGALQRLANSASSSFNKAFAGSSPALQAMVMHFGEIARSQPVVDMLTNMADAVLRVTAVGVEHASVLGYMLAGYTALRVISALPAMLTAVTVGLNAATLSMRTLTAAAGWIGVAVTALTVIYQLFIAETTEVEKADQRRQNSIAVNIEFLDREIERLTERNKLWNPETLQFNKPPENKVESAVEGERRVLAEREAALAIAQARAKSSTSEGSQLALANQIATLTDQTAKSKQRLWELTLKQEDLDIQTATDQFRRGQESTVTAINNFAKQGEAYDKLSANYAGKDNAAFLAKTQQAKEIQKLLVGNKITNEEAIGQLSKLKSEASGLLAGRAAKPDTAGENAALAAALKRLDVELQLDRLKSQSDISAARQQNKRGEIGDLQLINKELKAKLDLDQAALNAAKRQYELAEGKDKVGKMATYQGRADVAKKQVEVDTKEAAEKRLSVLAAMAQQELSFDAKTMAAKGQHVEAFLKEYDASYSLTIAKVNSDILAAQTETEKTQLQGFLAFLARLKQAGKDDAKGKEIQDDFGNVVDDLSAKLEDLKVRSGPVAGLAASFRNATTAAEAYKESLPEMIRMQQEMQDLADKTGDRKDQKAANSMLARIKSDAIAARNIWVDVSKAIGTSLENAFGQGGKALGDLLTATVTYGARQQQIQEDFLNSDGGAEAKKQAAKDTMSAQVAGMGQMAQAAAGFFDTQSKGYQTLMTVSKIFHAAELAMTLAELVPKGISAILGQGSGDPYSAFPRMAAMAAIVAGLGIAVGAVNGKPDTTAKDRQAAAGTGGVFGDFADKDGKYSTKSESIKRAIELSASNSNIELNYTSGMLRALLSIENALTGLGNLLIRGSGLTGDVAADKMGTAGQLGAKFSSGVYAGPLGAAMDKLFGGKISEITGKITNAIFGGKVSTLDVGLTANKTSVAQAMAGGLRASQYADTKKDGGLFHSDKYDTPLTPLGAEANAQISQIVTNMAKGITEAGKLLGLGGTDFTARLNAFVIDIGKISTKGLTGEQIQAQLETSFSKLGDDMARWTVQGMAPFQKVGEGYLETLVRVAANYANLDSVLKSIGMAFGATGMASLAAREHLIDLAGGIDELAAQASGFADNYLTTAERLAPVQAYVTEQLTAMGLASIDTRNEFKQHVLGLNLTVAAEQEQYVALMALQDAFAKVYAATEDVTKSQQEIADERRSLQDELDDLTMTSAQLLTKQRDALDASNRALFDQVQAAKAVVTAREDLNSAYEAEKQNLETNIDRIKSLGESWKTFRNNLLLGDKSTLTPQDKYAEARSQFETTLAAARGGDTDAQSRFEETANAFLEASRTANASSDAYAVDFTRVLAASADGVVWASQQVDIGKSSLDRLDASVAHLIDIKAGVMTTAQAMEKLLAADVALRAMQLKPEKDYAPGYQAAGPQYSTQGTTMSGQAAAAAAATSGGMTKEQADAMLRELTAAREAAERQAKEAAEHLYNATNLAAEKAAAAAREAAQAAAWNDNLRAQTA